MRSVWMALRLDAQRLRFCNSADLLCSCFPVLLKHWLPPHGTLAWPKLYYNLFRRYYIAASILNIQALRLRRVQPVSALLHPQAGKGL